MDPRLSPLWRRWDVLVEAALVGLAFVPGVERKGVDLAELPDRAMDALGWMLLLAQGATVALLQRRPAARLAVVGSAFGAYQLLGYPTTFAALGLLVCVVGAGALVRPSPTSDDRVRGRRLCASLQCVDVGRLTGIPAGPRRLRIAAGVVAGGWRLAAQSCSGSTASECGSRARCRPGGALTHRQGTARCDHASRDRDGGAGRCRAVRSERERTNEDDARHDRRDGKSRAHRSSRPPRRVGRGGGCITRR